MVRFLVSALVCLSLPALAQPTRSEIHGRVVKVRKHHLYVQERGVVIPLALRKTTELVGVSDSSQLKPGTEVRAHFTLDAARNVATRVERVSGAPQPSTRREEPPPEASTPTTERASPMAGDQGETKGPASPLPLTGP